MRDERSVRKEMRDETDRECVGVVWYVLVCVGVWLSFVVVVVMFVVVVSVAGCVLLHGCC